MNTSAQPVGQGKPAGIFISKQRWALTIGLTAVSLLFGAIGAFREREPWDDNAKLEMIYNASYKNQTVVLDGRHFVNPTFDDVTMVYSGTGGVFLENPKYVLHDGKMRTRIASRNKVVAMTLRIHAGLLAASGLEVEQMDLGPDAIDVPKTTGK